MVQKNSAAPSAPRGRPRSFDTDEVLDRVRDTFWRYGYAGTSMDQLSAATGPAQAEPLRRVRRQEEALPRRARQLSRRRPRRIRRGVRGPGPVRVARGDDRMVDRQVHGQGRGRRRLLHDAHRHARGDRGPGNLARGARIDGFARPRPGPPLRKGDRGRADLSASRSARAGDGDGRQPLRDFGAGAGRLSAGPNCGRWPIGRWRWSGR